MRERVTTDQIKLARTVDLISYMQRYEQPNKKSHYKLCCIAKFVVVYITIYSVR